MASKFKIFCDDQQQADNEIINQKRPLMATAGQAGGLNNATSMNHKLPAPNLASDNPIKREPLGLRQPALTTKTAQPLQQRQQPVPVQLDPHSSANTTASSATSTSNDLEEDQENDISMASLGSDFVPSFVNDELSQENDSFEEEQSGSIEGEEGEEYQFDDDDDGIEYDEELMQELNSAFKVHDESQLFKSISYVNDIKSYLATLERQSDFRPLPNYMDYQTEIDSSKRAVLVNWLVEVSDEYDLQTETLFISVGLIDRFLSHMNISTSNFQLLGVAAMFIASKYEEIFPPQLYQFVEVTDDTFSGPQICQMEREILKTLNFKISAPTTLYFLRQIFAYNKFSKEVYDLAEYLCYLSLLFDQPFLDYYPSEIAIASVILAAQELDSSANITPDLWEAYNRSNIDQSNRRRGKTNGSTTDKTTNSNADEGVRHMMNEDSLFCIEALIAIQRDAYTRSSKMLEDSMIVRKFSSTAHNSMALKAPPKNRDFLLFQDR